MAEAGHVTVISGLRELAGASLPGVELAVAAAMAAGAGELRFGGARGVDTVALAVASVLARGDPRLVVTVPFSVGDQPARAREVIERHADEVRELGLPRSRAAYLERNRVMLDGAQRLLAFTDGRNYGGTSHTIGQALRQGVEVDLVEVRGVWLRLPIPEALLQEMREPDVEEREVFCLEPYRGVSSDPGHELSCRVRRLVAGRPEANDVVALTDALVSLVEEHAVLRRAGALAFVPGSRPGEPGPMAPRTAATTPTAIPPIPRPTPAPCGWTAPVRMVWWSWTPCGPWAAPWRGPCSR